MPLGLLCKQDACLQQWKDSGTWGPDPNLLMAPVPGLEEISCDGSPPRACERGASAFSTLMPQVKSTPSGKENDNCYTRWSLNEVTQHRRRPVPLWPSGRFIPKERGSYPLNTGKNCSAIFRLKNTIVKEETQGEACLACVSHIGVPGLVPTSN